MKTKIWGSQGSIKELLSLIDKDFVPPFICRCKAYGRALKLVEDPSPTHILTCQESDDRFEIYSLDIEDGKINNAILLHKYSDNLLNGCVR